MAKFCTECGHALTDEMTFCSECGTQIPNKTPQANPSPEKTEKPQQQMQTKRKPAEEVCPKCGTPYRSGVPFCTECGTRLTESPMANPTNPNQTNVNPAPMGVPYVSASVPTAADMPCDRAYGVVSTAAFFWLDVLFKLPGLGWLFCIILSFAPKNVTIKHFARSKLVILVIVVICVGIAYAILAIFSDQIAAAMQGVVSDLLS